MNFALKFLVFLSFFQVFAAKSCEDSIENHLATKSPYRFVGNRNHTKIEYPDCKPLKLWMLARHGTRNPSEEYIKQMQTRLTNIKDFILENENQLFKSDKTLLEKWKLDLEATDEKKLTSEGSNEMIELAERLQARFPELLPPIYSNTSYAFKYTKTQRTRASAYSFAVGLFGRHVAKDVYFPEALKRDPVLRFYKLCSKWREDVKQNAATLKELTAFKSGIEVKKLIKDVEKKIGFKENTLTFDDVYYMYMACAFETAWSRKKRSPWCAPFTVDNIKIMEYAEDLKYYWQDGYGYELTYKQACAAFGNMMNVMEDPDEFPKATLYFTHSGTLLKMLAHLGLYKDEKPLNHLEIDENRKWKVSQIDPFGTNLVFVSYKCGKEVKILLLHQENVVRFPCCPNEDLCSLETLKKFYTESVQSCNFNKMCDIK